MEKALIWEGAASGGGAAVHEGLGHQPSRTTAACSGYPIFTLLLYQRRPAQLRIEALQQHYTKALLSHPREERKDLWLR